MLEECGEAWKRDVGKAKRWRKGSVGCQEEGFVS